MKKHQFELVAQSPAKLAEEYLVKSIWHKDFPPGSDLPAERELAEKIGVTRTTLREVLQRLARDGWLSIQHGKATKVNDIWQTAGPSIIHTLLQLDDELMPVIVNNMVSLRTQMGERYIPEAIEKHNAQALAIFQTMPKAQDDAQVYAEFDYALYRQFAFVAGKPVYGLILNSFQDLYIRVASFFFQQNQMRQNAFQFYQQLQQCCAQNNVQQAKILLAENQKRNQQLWQQMLTSVPENFLK